MVSDVPVYDRYQLRAGTKFAGPVVFEEHESTFVVGFDAEVTVDPALNLIAELS
jgi:N-methylhydantoinase A/oxoprolinase/acetone carboxylase beta subunit